MFSGNKYRTMMMLSFLLDFVLHPPCLFKDGFPQKSHQKKKVDCFLGGPNIGEMIDPIWLAHFFSKGLVKKNTNYRYGADIQFELRWDVLEVVFFEIPEINYRMVNCWFGSRWFGFLGSPYGKGLLLRGTPIRIQKPRGPKPPTGHYLTGSGFNQRLPSFFSSTAIGSGLWTFRNRGRGFVSHGCAGGDGL